MITRLKLKLGQNGTKALVKKYGDALVCVTGTTRPAALG